MKNQRKCSRHLVALTLLLAGLIIGIALPSSSWCRPSPSVLMKQSLSAKLTSSPVSRATVAELVSPKSILIYGPSLDSSGDPNEQSLAQAAGYTVTVADEATWTGMTTAQFAAFDAIVFGDPRCGQGTELLATANATKSVWSRAITGPVYVQGTDPVWHGINGEPVRPETQILITDGISFVAGGHGTGLYASLSCYYEGSGETPADFLSAIGDFRISDAGCANSVTIVNPTHPAMAGLTDESLSNWGCSVHEFITNFPSTFEVLATAIRDSDGVSLPYIIATGPAANPIDDAGAFVRQHYLDFLNREPDPGGLAYWTDRITQCGADARCIHERRIGVSAAFFIELEFQDTGYYVYRFYKASFGRQPNYAEFTLDRSKVVDGPSLEANKQAFAEEWVQRPAFLQAYPNTLSNTEFVNKLFDTAGLTGSTYDPQRQQEIAAMNAGRSRALVLREVIEIPDFKNVPDPSNPRYSEIKQISQYNPAFVLMQYFGYLRRNVDQKGYDSWLDVLDNRAPNNYPAMVCAFLTTREFQLRFGSVVTRSNADCGP